MNNVFPSAIYSSVSSRCVYAEDSSQRSIRKPLTAERSQFSHPVFSQFRQTMLRPTLLFTSSLAHHVIMVIFISTKKQVIRSYAGRIITTVKHFHVVRNRAKVDLPRHSVRSFGPSLLRPNTISPIIKSATFPKPARSSFLHKCHESLRNKLVPMGKLTSTRAVFWVKWLQYCAAILARSCYFKVNHAGSHLTRINVARPVRMLNHPFGSFCILPLFHP